MKKILILTLASLLLFSCGSSDKNQSIDDLIKSQNVTALQAKKTTLQAEMTKIEEALAKLNLKKVEALVSTQVVKDTVFNHYLDIQGNVDTKENILVQPEFSGNLTSLTVKAGQRVS